MTQRGFVLDGSLIILHGQESALSWSFCIRRTKVAHMNIGCGVTVVSEMGRVAFPAIEAHAG